jgi:hypothetical protein
LEIQERRGLDSKSRCNFVDGPQLKNAKTSDRRKAMPGRTLPGVEPKYMELPSYFVTRANFALCR